MVLVLVGKVVWNMPRRGWSLKEARQISVASKAVVSPKDIRHVVLISIDTCRADHLGCYGYSRKTSPCIDAVAAEGILFNHAVTSVPITLPSHSSMLTGTIPLYHKVRDNNSYRLTSSNVTLAEVLRENGFTTGAVIGAFVLDSQFGLDQGFETYEDSVGKENKTFFRVNERKAGEVTRLANLWLEQHHNDSFFLFLHYYDPHYPYDLHKSFTFTSLLFFAFTKDKYDSEIAYTDYCVSQVIRKLKELGLYDSTLLIITSDHGESLKEHSESSHGYLIYHSTLHVPLIFKVPGGPEGERINELAGLIDIVPTVFGCLGIAIPPHVQGRDLSIFFSNNRGSIEQRSIYCESLMPTKFDLSPFLGLVSNRWKYIHSSKPELYDLREDHRETKNLLNEQAQKAYALQDQLRRILQNYGSDEAAESKVAIDEETRKRLESLGYISSRAVDDNIQFDQKTADPKNFIELYNFSERFLELASTKKFDKAKKLCANILAKWPDMKRAYYFLGLIAVSEEDAEGIINHFSQYLLYTESDSSDFAMRVKPTNECANAHLNLGTAFQHKGQTEQAVAHFKKAILYNPYWATARYNLAAIYMTQGKLNDASAYCAKALELDPDMPEANCMMGDILLRRDKIEDAITHYEKAVESRPDWPPAQSKLKIARNSAIALRKESLRRNSNDPNLQKSGDFVLP